LASSGLAANGDDSSSDALGTLGMGPMSVRGLTASPSALRAPAKPFSPPVLDQAKRKRASNPGAANGSARKSAGKGASKSAGAGALEMVAAGSVYAARRASESKVGPKSAQQRAPPLSPTGYDDAEFSILGAAMGGFSPGASLGFDLSLAAAVESPTKRAARNASRSSGNETRQSPGAAEGVAAAAKASRRSEGEARKKSPRMFAAIERDIAAAVGQPPPEPKQSPSAKRTRNGCV
jgi:hypothetical protein